MIYNTFPFRVYSAVQGVTFNCIFVPFGTQAIVTPL
jgi:hypothetical protein